MRLRKLRTAWRLLWATPAQETAVEAVLTGRVVVPEAGQAPKGQAGFDETERRLSLALDALLNAVEAYRELKRGGRL